MDFRFSSIDLKYEYQKKFSFLAKLLVTFFTEFPFSLNFEDIFTKVFCASIVPEETQKFRISKKQY